MCQERDKQFPIKPSAGTAVVMFGHVPQLGKALQSLKHQLNLPNAYGFDWASIADRTMQVSR